MKLKILCVHGVSGHAPGGDWEEREWRLPLQAVLGDAIEIEFCHLDAPFDAVRLSPLETAQALLQLAGNWLRPRGPEPKAFARGLYARTAGMVLEWVRRDALRKQCRQLLQARIEAFKPNLVIAHSLGSLVAYDCFSHVDSQHCAAGLHLLVCGSQLAHPAVTGCFGGRVAVPPKLPRLTQLFNVQDRVFSEALTLRDPRFARIDTPFSDAPLHHTVAPYLAQLAQVLDRWGDWLPPRRAAKATGKSSKARAPRRRALLVGVNEFLDPATSPLKGCVNDAWLMSAVLQESGFDADEIRMVLNQRATSAAISERLDWLVDGAQAGDTCVFYFSGHGAQVPVYGGDGQHVVAVHESLVPHDFDWTRGHAFSDQQFAALYSQLPYALNFLAIFDCCHSGGLTRSGSQRVRGLTPPDDIRHRMLRWDAAREMWLPRQFESPNAEFARKFGASKSSESVQATHRMGQALQLRGQLSVSALKRRAAEYGHLGPYMPTLLYACEDAQFAYEYEHGPISHGAFTYSLVKRLRAARRVGKLPSFAQLAAAVRKELQELGYAQTPHLVAPSSVKTMAVPLKA